MFFLWHFPFFIHFAWYDGFLLFTCFLRVFLVQWFCDWSMISRASKGKLESNALISCFEQLWNHYLPLSNPTFKLSFNVPKFWMHWCFSISQVRTLEAADRADVNKSLMQGLKNGYFTVSLTVWGEGGGAAPLALTVSKCEHFYPFFSMEYDSDSMILKTHFISLWRVSKMHYSCPFLMSKWGLASCNSSSGGTLRWRWRF